MYEIWECNDDKLAHDNVIIKTDLINRKSSLFKR